MKQIGQLLRQLRKEARLTQEEFGKRIGVSKQAVSNYEKDFRRPDYETLEAIADVLNKPIGFFISEEEKQAELKRINGEVRTVSSEREQKIMHIIDMLSNLPPDKLDLAMNLLKALQ